MASNPLRLYWDSSCFICFLNRSELERRAVCGDILRNARAGSVELYTSTFTISEVANPRRSSISNPRCLTEQEISKIHGMFLWPWLRTVDVDQRVAFRAAELTRDYRLLPADAIHAATAILLQVDALQNWDKDFSRISHLVRVENPVRMSDQGVFDELMERIGPHPDDF